MSAVHACRQSNTKKRYPGRISSNPEYKYGCVFSEFGALFAEAQSEPFCPQANVIAVCLSLLTAAYLIWNCFEATSVLCIVIYLIWGFRALVIVVRDAMSGKQPKHVTMQQLRRAGLITAVILTCVTLSLAFGWSNAPTSMLRFAGQRMIFGHIGSIVSALALSSMEFCALAKVIRYLMHRFRDWKSTWKHEIREHEVHQKLDNKQHAYTLTAAAV
jgi:hypothetical protein